MARAARAIPAAAAPAAPAVLWGYADGGRAAIWAADLHGQYAPTVDIRGIAAGAVVTDPGEIARGLDGGPWSALGLAGLIGLARAHRHLPLRHVLTHEARVLLADAESLSMPVLCQRYLHPIGTWCTRPDPWDDPMWRHILAHELPSPTGFPAAPVHLYHGRADTVVPVRYGRRLYQDYRARGVRVSWCEYPGNHFRAALDATDDVLSRLADNLATPGGVSGEGARP
jgi:fermentation-respiration switch protein FrsA (DUF1100 family)